MGVGELLNVIVWVSVALSAVLTVAGRYPYPAASGPHLHAWHGHGLDGWFGLMGFQSKIFMSTNTTNYMHDYSQKKIHA